MPTIQTPRLPQMLRPILLVALAAALVIGVELGFAGDGEEHVLSGTYTSSYQDRPGRVRAVFTPRQEGEEARWDVVFHFTFSSQEHTYRGVAEGGLTEGELSGRVLDESGSRTFTFRGEHKKGKYRATHAEVFDDGEEKTGSMTLEG